MHQSSVGKTASAPQPDKGQTVRKDSQCQKRSAGGSEPPHQKGQHQRQCGVQHVQRQKLRGDSKKQQAADQKRQRSDPDGKAEEREGQKEDEYCGPEGEQAHCTGVRCVKSIS